MPFAVDLTPWLKMVPDRAWLDANVKWKDYGNGNKLGRLKREDGVGLVLYHVAANAPADAFSPHTHTGGEVYIVLEGEVFDDEGTYPKGSIVWMKPGSRHTPKTRGDTLILVLWPNGVEA